MEIFSSHHNETNTKSEKKVQVTNDELLFVRRNSYEEEKVDLKNTERALLNILEDYSKEKYHSENSQRALLNILEDYSKDKYHSENSQRALLNILDDYSQDKYHSENSQKALLNILDDYSEEKNYSENSQKALLNILDDYHAEKINMENILHAVLNILEDYGEEKLNLEKTQSAVLNILDDYSEEKRKIENINKDLSSANKELEQYAYISAHDLQEPLRTISNFVELIDEKYSGKLDKDVDQYIQFIVTATSRMQNLIKDLLDFSRTGRDVTFVAVDCAKVLKELIVEMDPSIEESNAQIRTATLPVVKGDEIELKRLFHNLISNAIKFRKKEGDLKIEITVEEKDNEYIFAIKDNGIGIEEQNINKLFVIFQRLNSVTEFPGTGIGLATCKKIVALHNGKIWVESKFGEGSTFYFTISKKLIQSKNYYKNKLYPACG